MAYKRNRKSVTGLTRRKSKAVRKNLMKAQVSRIGMRGRRRLKW